MLHRVFHTRNKEKPFMLSSVGIRGAYDSLYADANSALQAATERAKVYGGTVVFAGRI